MKKWEKIVTALGAALFLYTAEPVFAFEPFYLNGDQTQPMGSAPARTPQPPDSSAGT